MDDDDEDDEEDEMPLDMEEVENASKKARQEEEIHSEHVQVRSIFFQQRLVMSYSLIP